MDYLTNHNAKRPANEKHEKQQQRTNEQTTTTTTAAALFSVKPL